MTVAQSMPLTLRPYQADAVDAVYDYLRTRDDNPCVVIPTAGGKTPCLATICKDAVQQWDGRVLILAHVKELLEQAADKLQAICPEIWFGIYSAGLKRRDTDHPVIIAGIQSVYKRACELDAFDLIIVDEAHLIPPAGSSGDGMYRQFLADMKVINPNVRVIGMTATPYRMKSGSICGPEDDGFFLNHVCYEIGVKELIRDGYLCPLITKAGRHKVDTENLHVRAGEFIASEVEDLMDNDFLVKSACSEIIQQTAERQACLIFASGVTHGKHIQSELEKNHGVECGFVDGSTPSLFRDEVLQRFRAGDLKYLCNVNVLTTGFDAPKIDCVALVRPTLSPGLFYQMVGRGFRLHPGKQNCLVLDFGGNVIRHGPVDQIQIEEKKSKTKGEAPAKECPKCQSVVGAGYARCPDCGYEFPPPESNKHEAEATNAGILSGQVTDTKRTVSRLFYNVHEKRDAPPEAPKTMRVEYQTGFNEFTSEWICFEHTGFARRKAEQWWIKRSSESIPSTAEEAVELAEAGALCDTLSITVREIAGERFGTITDYELGEKHDQANEPDYTIAEDDIPF